MKITTILRICLALTLLALWLPNVTSFTSLLATLTLTFMAMLIIEIFRDYLKER